MSIISLMHFVDLKLIGMDRNVWKDFTENVVNACVNYVAYAATDYVHRDLGFV